MKGLLKPRHETPSPHFLQRYILVRYVQGTICSIWNQSSHRKKKEKMEEAKER